MCDRGHVWQRGACMVGVCMASGACMAGGMHGEGRAWQERQPLQQMVRILLECILVYIG